MIKRYCSSKLGLFGLLVVALYFFVGVYAPLLAASKPLAIKWNDTWYFPLFRYLFFKGYYTKPVDLFFNLLMFTVPLALLTRRWVTVALLQTALFATLWFFPLSDPTSDLKLSYLKQEQVQAGMHGWAFDLTYKNPYAQLDTLTEALRLKRHHERLQDYVKPEEKIYTPYTMMQEELAKDPTYRDERATWLKAQSVEYVVWPLLREFHWQDDAGGDQELNQKVPWWELTRINRKDLVASLLFGIRISLMVGVLSIAIAFAIGVPMGALAGYFAGTTDIVICRLLEVWEAMPTFFMLLLVVSMTQSKSIFLVILVIGFFGWTSFSRYIRGEFFKERSLPYVEACTVLGFSPTYTMFHHILPNAIPPLLTLLPFAILGAITAEAGLSFLGLGEEGSASWGVLMDEGRQAFPSESYLLWPPAILLTILLIAIALVGDALRDALDPKN